MLFNNLKKIKKPFQQRIKNNRKIKLLKGKRKLSLHLHLLLRAQVVLEVQAMERKIGGSKSEC